MSLSPAELTRLAEAGSLLVVSDFDGTLAGLSTDIYGVPVNLDAVAALTRLAGLPGTHVAVLSGRHLEGLAQVCGLREPVVRCGSHGAESSEDPTPLTPAMTALLDRVEEEMEALLNPPLTFVERKPFQRVAHTAPLAAEDQEAADAVLDRVLERVRALGLPGTRVTRGKNIVEFSVTDVTKGTWLAGQIDDLDPDVAVFIGDDTTDEDGFRVLRPGDVGVKVGPGETAAGHRVADIPAVAALLTSLADARAAHLGVPHPLLQRFEAVAAGFSAEVQRVRNWSAATPCEGWSSRDIVAHLLTWYPAALRDADVDLEVATDLQSDPAGSWFRFVAAVRDLLGDEERAGTVFHSGPHEGSTVAQATVAYFLPDVFMHTWDLARSQGHDVRLDDAYATRNLAGLEAVGEALQATGQFGPPHEVAADARPGEKLMAYVGRAPSFGVAPR